jgi:ATP-dependent helicase/nuclease subunit B
MGNVREAIDRAKTFEMCCDALGELAEAMSDEDIGNELTLSELCDLLTFYFSKTDMGTIPTSADEVVIGSASMLRADSPKCALILGMCDGVFPAPVKDGGILSFYEKNILAELDVKFAHTSESAASDELMYLHRAVSMPFERLYLLTYTNSSDGRKTTPSLPFECARKMLEEAGDKDRVLTYDGKDMLSLTPSLRAALQYLPSLKGTAAGEAINECALQDEKLCRLVTKNAPPVSNTECSVSEETVQSLYGSQLYLSQSRIDKFVNCNFNYYCSYVLKLREEQISRFKANDIGTFIHHILEKLLSSIVNEDGIDTSISLERIQELTREIVENYILLISKGMPKSARLGHLYKRLYNLSLLLICNIIEEFRHSSFRPKYFELNTNGKGDNPTACEFELKNGTKVVFSGVIDRVDVLKLEDGKVYIRVVDYKTGTKQFALDDIKHGLNIQMLLYLFTLQKNKNEAFYNDVGSNSPYAAGVVYLSSNIPQLETEDYEDAQSIFAKAQKMLTRSGLLIDDIDILRAMNDELSPDYLGGIRLKKDGTLGGNALTSAERFDALRDEIDKTLTSISEKIISGCADAEPLAYGKKDPCEFCAMKPICRRPIK